MKEEAEKEGKVENKSQHEERKVKNGGEKKKKKLRRKRARVETFEQQIGAKM